MTAFEELFLAEGWQETTERGPEDGFEKIALYTLNGIPTHACRLLDSGMWTSKLGLNIDLSHEVDELEGPEYGQIAKIYRKPLA